MGTYSDGEFERKLNDLRDSQKEIQSISAWLVHHRAHSRSIIKVWYKNFKSIQKARKLTFMYLANDVVQNSRRKGQEYVKEFSTILMKVFHHLSSLGLEDKTKQSLGRLLHIWGERQIFEKSLLQDVENMWSRKSKAPLDTSTDSIKSTATTPSRKHSSNSGGAQNAAEIAEERRKSDNIDIDEMLESPLRKLNQSKDSSHDTPSITQLLEESTTLSPRLASPGSGDPPEPEELIVALQNLENAASSDAEVREKIAKLPPEVSEITKLEALTTAQQGRDLLVQVEAASSLLDDYNSRLQEELKERKRVGNMVSEFLSAQRELLAQAEERLEQYYEKLEKMKGMERDLRSHIAALPDIPVLPGSGSGLDALPRGGDLFR
eukprot:TRINITY_DN10067_c1_g1_i1.p1 TRINITY_DN10067_c1_g1~~TRINITY_DN10067_c1_g1_i1.p1  ORF type:complete len:394 (-),score=94.22 TRINITY_DN10067_c1_g1_i1:588-1721(-)